MNDKTPNLLTIAASAFTQKVKDTVTGISNGEKTLVSLVAVCADRWYLDGKNGSQKGDSGGADTIGNFVNALSDYPAKQKAAARLFAKFVPVEILIDEEGKATATNTIKLSALTDEQKQSYSAAIEAFKAAKFPSLAAAVKPQTGKRDPKKLDLISTTTKTTKAVEKVLEKAIADGVDRASALAALAAWIDQEIKKAKAPALEGEHIPADKAA
ncbi:hypothetical protein DRT11_23920 [Salmonella enterica subsp. enterica]|nr:hypothetical protein [Salmonella enterica subsp. enterica serovar Bareilly]